MDEEKLNESLIVDNFTPLSKALEQEEQKETEHKEQE